MVAALIAVAGVVVTAWVTMGRGRLDARYTFAAEIQLSGSVNFRSLLSCTTAYRAKSKCHEKLLWTLRQERKRYTFERFPLAGPYPLS